MGTLSLTCVFDVATQQVTATDSSTYGITWRDETFLQTALSRALFWSTDDFSSNADSDLTDPGDYEWTFAAITPNTYSVKAYFILAYDAGLTKIYLPPWTIASSGGKIYIFNPTSDEVQTFATSNPATDSDWKELAVGKALNMTAYGGSNYASLTDIDIYNIFELSYDKACIPGYATAEVTTSDQEYTVTKTDCNEWEIEYLYGTKTFDTVLLLDYNGDTLETLTPDGYTINVDLTNYGDGAYIVKITYTDDSIAYVTIYEICEAQACYKQLVKYLLCSCNDPCDDCDDNLSRMADLNSLLTLFEALKEMIYLERYQYLGVYDLTDTRDEMVTEIGTMIDKLIIITDRCGLCDEDDDNTITCD